VICDQIGWKSRKLIKINCTFALCSQKAAKSEGLILPGEHREILGRLEVGKNGVLGNKSFNISETRKDEGKVTMEGL